jgi:hypothetical protein
MATTTSTLPAHGLTATRRSRTPGRQARRAAAYGALALAVAGSVGLTTAAAQHASPLSPPSNRVDVHWLYGPLHGLLPHLSRSPALLHRGVLVALIVMLVAWVVAWLAAPAVSVRAVWAAVGAAFAVTLLGPPQGLTDLFNYLSYGRMAARGVNPYAIAPFTGSPHDLLYHLSNWHHLRSPYGPLFTLLSEPLGLLPLPTAYVIWKVIVVLTAFGVLALVAWLASALGVSVQRALVVAGLCPATLAIGLGGFHNDPPAILAVLGGLACLVQARRTGRPGWSTACGALVVVGCGLKPSFAVVLPVLVLGCPHRLRAAVGAAAAGAAVGAVVLVAFGGQLPDVSVQGSLVSPLSVPNLVGALLGRGGADATLRAASSVAVALSALAGAALVLRRPDRVAEISGGVLLASALSLSWAMPWYVGWALPFAALGRSRALALSVVFATILLTAGGLPQAVDIIHAFGYYPSHNAVGLANHERIRSLVR